MRKKSSQAKGAAEAAPDTAPAVRWVTVRDGVFLHRKARIDNPDRMTAENWREAWPSFRDEIAALRADFQTQSDADTSGVRWNRAAVAARALDFVVEKLDAITDPQSKKLAVDACYNMMLAMLEKRYLDVKRIEPEIITGAKNRTGMRNGNATRVAEANASKAAWQREADKIWSRNPRLTPAAVARLIDPNRAGYIRKKIVRHVTGQTLT